MTPFKLDVILVSTLVSLSHIMDDVSSKQASKPEDSFTVDLIWWGSLRLAPIIIICMHDQDNMA